MVGECKPLSMGQNPALTPWEKKGSVNWSRAQVVLMGPLNPLAAPSQIILPWFPGCLRMNIGELYVN